MCATYVCCIYVHVYVSHVCVCICCFMYTYICLTYVYVRDVCVHEAQVVRMCASGTVRDICVSRIEVHPTHATGLGNVAPPN